MSDTPIYDDNLDKPTPVYGDLTTGENDVVKSKKPEAKVVAATVGAGVGSALGEIIVWVIEATANIDIPANVEVSVGIVISAALAFVGGYFKKS